MKITLPYPPTVNTLYATVNGNRVLSRRGREFKAEVLNLCFAFKVKPLSGNLSLKLSAYRPQKRGDLDNLLKIVQDSMKGIAFEDDKQIVEIHAYRYDDKQNPRVEVEISQV